MIARRSFAGLFAGAASILAAPAIVRAAGREAMTVRLDWIAGADHAFLFLAKARGYYADVGIDVDFLDGKGSMVALQAVATGNDTLGIANLSTMALAVGAGAPLTAIACILQKAPDCLIALASSGILKPKDLVGKIWGFVPTDAGQRLFPAFARNTGIDPESIKRIQLTPAAGYTSLLVGNVDFISGWVISDALKLGQIKPIAPPIVYADYGVDSLGNGFLASRDTVASRGDLLKAFLAATAKGSRDAQRDPAAAVDALMAARPSTNKVVALKQAAMLPAYLHTAASQGHVFGWMAAADWQNTLKLLQDCCRLAPGIDQAQLYTNALLAAA